MLHRRIQNYDLFACEARYHPKCRKEYTRNLSAWRSNDPDNVTHFQNLEEAHQFAFDYISNYVEHTVISSVKKIVPLSSLRLMYTATLDMKYFPNPNYDSRKRRQRIEKHPVLGSKLVFAKIENRGSVAIFSSLYFY